MVQPVVHRTCMEMDDVNMPFPMQAEVDTMTDHVYNILIRDYSEIWDEEDQVTGEQYWDDDRYRRDRRFSNRPRGVFRDLVAILLLQELFRRRRIYY